MTNTAMTNTEFDLQGVCHLAVVCEDMERTVDFYTNVLGMKLSKTITLPGGMGQHFFFHMGGDQYLAFFWFKNAPAKAPGVASSAVLPGVGGDIATAHGSMNHVAFKVPLEKFDEYAEKLRAKGVVTGPVLNHDDSERGASPEVHEGTFVRSIYFFDPDGILLEFAAWTRALRPDDVNSAPMTKDGVLANSAVSA
ncbi:catechol 2,3-dioxygenase-like lactoylglutathione lyase family enzyme [Antricoccus suffuscus]|uniref:Catechol 2,3-dioxygenase-like lactoylglutathione lyase family enzyme n=1 Tax=Antricoccus suffuscus TaxID=1629062 RepID=A0A2T0ZZ11_9ACTN|nr:VOC family protein [Antricoccus suffuscus]PRZ41580.1 catechol 2,3-dioxygenase-like lactoylglutathione lyase family enzyme [Antricoccus suffuscus]